MKTILVTDKPTSWAFLNEFTSVIDSSSYLFHKQLYKQKSIRVINLSETYHYQSIGYYISLLAEARLQQVIPSPLHIQDSLNLKIFKYISSNINQEIQAFFQDIEGYTYSLNIYFGMSGEKKFQSLVSKLHDLFPIPLKRVDFVKKKKWFLKSLTPLAVDKLSQHDRMLMQTFAYDFFVSLNVPISKSLDSDNGMLPDAKFNRKQSHLHPTRQYKLAILIDPEEGETAPSNTKALENFVSAGKKNGFSVDFLTKKDAVNIINYDALFVRTTTAVNHYSYQLSRCAAQSNLIVIDDPQSIVRCTNKIFLAELFDNNDILTPKTQFLSKYDPVLPVIEFPCVLKKPDSSCSLGVVKIDNLKTLKQTLQQFFKTSDILLIQPFIYTEFDWRIGILDNKPLYASRYYMAKNHWQIVNWDNDDCLIHEPVFIDDVPKAVIQLAQKSTKLIGDGLYGVDIKSAHNTNYVIEVNDNPSINCGIEDVLLKNTLYENIIDIFLQRVQKN